MSKDAEWQDKGELNNTPYGDYNGYDRSNDYARDDGVIREEDLVAERGPVFRWLSKAFAMGVEARGIERVPEDERDGKHTIGLLLLWWSVNSVVSTVPIGVGVTLSCRSIADDSYSPKHSTLSLSSMPSLPLSSSPPSERPVVDSSLPSVLRLDCEQWSSPDTV